MHITMSYAAADAAASLLFTPLLIAYGHTLYAIQYTLYRHYAFLRFSRKDIAERHCCHAYADRLILLMMPLLDARGCQIISLSRRYAIMRLRRHCLATLVTY